MAPDKIAFGHQTAALYGTGAPVAQPDPAAPGADNIVNDNNRPEEPVAAEDRPTPMRYSAELAKQLRNVAVETWSTGDRKEFDALAAKAVKQTRKSERQAVCDSFERFGAQSEAIQSSLARLASHSARDMADALKRCSDWDTARQVLEDENAPGDSKVRAQEKLAQLTEPTSAERERAAEYESLVSALSDLAQDLRDFSENGKLTDGVRYAVDDLVLTLESRVSELGTLGMHLVEMAEQAEEQEGAYAEILDGERNMVDLAKGMGGVMHGNYESVALHADKVADACDALGQTLDRLETEVVSGKELEDCQSAFVNADVQISSAEGRLNGELAQRMDPKVLEGLRSKISQLRDRLEHCRDLAACKARLRFVESLPRPFATVLSKTDEETLRLCPRLMQLRRAHEAFVDALKAYAEAGAGEANQSVLEWSILDCAGMFDGEDALALLRDLRDELRALAGRGALTDDGQMMWGALDQLEADGKKPAAKRAAFVQEIFGLRGFSAQEIFCAYRDQIDAIGAKKGSGVFLAGDVAKVAAGEGTFSDLLLASMYDVGIKWIDRDLVDGPGVQERRLGAGAVNTVVKITYPPSEGNGDPKTIVFKPDFLATVGNTRLSLAADGYEGTQQALKLNLASTVVARRLGCEGRLTKASAMFHKGQFGIGMTYAPGVEAKDFAKTRKPDLDSLLQSGDPAQRRKGLRIGNDIVRQTIDLTWTDLLTGQGDRHGGNYRIHFDVNADPPETVVTGIDNDLCMQKYRVGLTRFRLSEERRELLRKKLIGTIAACGARYVPARYANPRNAKQVAEGVADQMMHDFFDADGVIDFNQTPPLPAELVFALQSVLGVKSLCVPKVMSQTMYDRLRAINEDGTGLRRQEFIDEITELMPPANVQAFAVRLDDLLALVRDGRITAVPEPTEANPTPWLAEDVIDGMVQQAKTYPPAQDELQRTKDFERLEAVVNKLVGTPVSRHCDDLLQALQLAAKHGDSV